MAQEIDPENKAQMKAVGAVKVIDGRDKVQCLLTKENPIVKGHKRADGTVQAGQHRAGEKCWMHPDMAEIMVRRGWVSIIEGTEKRYKMPEGGSKDVQAGSMVRA